MGLFTKKINLVDLLNGFNDIHNHLLPGIDDGAQNIEEAIQLVKMYKDIGITNFYATPHTMSDSYPNTKKTILNALNTLQSALEKEGIAQNFTITAASEYMLDYEFEELLKKDDLLTLKDNHVLIEMSYLHAFDRFNEVVYDLQLKGYQPILAHPERYLYYIDDKTIFTQIKNRGVKLQLNALSLSDYYGSKIKDKALKLLKEGMYDFIGLDTHKTKHLVFLEKVKIAKKYQPMIEQLIANNKTLV